jgi:predicted nuclease of predicted toxin-antitoxin system
MRLLVDMNLSPDWIPVLEGCGWEAIHWIDVGAPNAPDTDLLAHARDNNRIVLTQDLDFAQLLFASRDAGPSVVILRIVDEFDSAVRQHVCEMIRSAAEDLENGALLTISSSRARLRKLPI